MLQLHQHYPASLGEQAVSWPEPYGCAAHADGVELCLRQLLNRKLCLRPEFEPSTRLVRSAQPQAARYRRW
ncbi:MAG: hypothetical protein U0401_10375 [Anaerolineae bacterium]